MTEEQKAFIQAYAIIIAPLLAKPGASYAEARRVALEETNRVFRFVGASV